MSVKNISKIDFYIFIVNALGRNPAARAGTVVLVLVAAAAVAAAMIYYSKNCRSQATTDG